MDPLSRLLDDWRTHPNIAAWRTLPARDARVAPFPAALHPALISVLERHGIHGLYTHQAAAWQCVAARQNPVIVTGTASGKTLAYNLPVLDCLLRDAEARALYLFPTKALAQDQLATLQTLIAALESTHLPLGFLQAATYDGDTPKNLRAATRKRARLVISNPDMLHAGILPYHTRWADFLSRLQFVIIDELHTYRGIFGAHVANVLRRLMRVARFYGASPQFVLTSATIANPVDLAEQLIEQPVVLVDDDGAPRGAKHFLIYNPPVVNAELGVRRSAMQESVGLAASLVEQQVQTLVFGRARRSVEIMRRYLGERLNDADAVRSYRSGYLPQQRRDIERSLRAGEVKAVVATSALELGIDVGQLGAVILSGYPGTIAGTWQQAGRAGRRNETAAAVLVASANPLDQFLAHNPDYFFERSPEHARINANHLLVLWQHLRCAAFELPFEAGESMGSLDAAHLAEWLDVLRSSGEVHASGGKFFWMAASYPAADVSLRTASPEVVSLVAAGRTIGQVDASSALWFVHPEAIYLHDGQSYRVEALELDTKTAQLKAVEVDYYTEPIRETTIECLAVTAQADVTQAVKHYGELEVTTQVVGYQRIRWHTHERLGNGEVSLPPSSLQTTGYWLTLPPETVTQLQDEGLWSNAPNDYGPKWPQIRKEVRARDGYRCQMCGVAEDGQAHDVHHKIPFRLFDSVAAANQRSNLVTLCRACHRRAEMAVKVRSGLSGVAYTLSHLAPLFLMCDHGDIAVYADPMAPFTARQPTIAIYDLAPGGLGFSERLFTLHDTLVTHAHDLIKACACTEGCPSCVGPGGEQGRGGKQETLAILRKLRRATT